MNKNFERYDSEDSVSKYFKEVRKSVVLSTKEEIELTQKIKDGDEDAKIKLIEANLKFVVSIAKEYQGQGLLLSDLISEGNYGLIKAASKFDHDRGFKFISYAVWWIRQSIIQSINDNSRVVRLPVNVINKMLKSNKELFKFENSHQREPISGDLMSDGDSFSKINHQKCLSLNHIINEDGDEMMDMLSSEQINLDEKEFNIKVKQELNKTLDSLEEKERVIIESYFGVNIDSEPMTLEAIGEKYKLTKERIRQIKEKAIRKLRYNSNDLQNLIDK